MQHYICFDIETGGFDANKNLLAEIALIAYDSQNFEEKFRYESLVKPYGDLSLEPDAIKIHGLTLGKLQNEGTDVKEVIDVLIEVFQTFTSGNKKWKIKPILVAHNGAEFDVPFLDIVFKMYDKNIFDYISRYVEDTLFLGRSKWIGQYNKFNLASCCKYAGIEITDAHRAMNDCEPNKKLHQFFAQTLRQNINFVQQQEENNFRTTFQF